MGRRVLARWWPPPALGVAGFVVPPTAGWLASSAVPDPRSAERRARAGTHPVALAMIVGNVVLLAISVVQLS